MNRTSSCGQPAGDYDSVYNQSSFVCNYKFVSIAVAYEEEFEVSNSYVAVNAPQVHIFSIYSI